MAEVRETQVTKDMEGNVVDRQTTIEHPKKQSGFGWGLLFGVLIVAGAIVAYAYNQGSFRTAGARADRATQTAQVELNQTADNTRRALNNATKNNSQQQPTSSN